MFELLARVIFDVSFKASSVAGSKNDGLQRVSYTHVELYCQYYGKGRRQ